MLALRDDTDDSLTANQSTDFYYFLQQSSTSIGGQAWQYSTDELGYLSIAVDAIYKHAELVQAIVSFGIFSGANASRGFCCLPTLAKLFQVWL